MIVSNLVKFKKSLREAGLIETALRTLHWFKIISVLHSFDFTLKELSIRDGVLILNSFDEIDAPKVSQINGLHISMREIKEIVHGHLEASSKQAGGKETFTEYHS